MRSQSNREQQHTEGTYLYEQYKVKGTDKVKALFDKLGNHLQSVYNERNMIAIVEALTE